MRWDAPSLTSAACLRAVSQLALAVATPAVVYPFIDGTVLAQAPGEGIADGAFNHVPVISGSNHDEWRYFIALQYDLGALGPLTDAEYPAAVYQFFQIPPPPTGNPFADFLISTLYPLNKYP